MMMTTTIIAAPPGCLSVLPLAGGSGPLHRRRPQNPASPRPRGRVPAPRAPPEPLRRAAEALFRPLAPPAGRVGPVPGPDRPHDSGTDDDQNGDDSGVHPPHPPVPSLKVTTTPSEDHRRPSQIVTGNRL